MERRLFYEKRIVLWKEDCFVGYKLSNPFRLYRNLYELVAIAILCSMKT